MPGGFVMMRSEAKDDEAGDKAGAMAWQALFIGRLCLLFVMPGGQCGMRLAGFLRRLLTMRV